MFILNLNLRSPRTIALAALLAALLVLVALLQVVRVETYARATLVTGSWGAGDGQFGQGRGADGKPYGPRSFALAGDGSLLVADTFNGRLLRFDPSGSQVAAIPAADGKGIQLQGIDDLALDQEGNTYLVDNRRGTLFKLDPQGKVLAEIRIGPVKPGPQVFLAERVQVDRSGNIYLGEVFFDDEQYTRRIRRLEAGGSREVKVNSYAVKPDGTLTIDGDSLIPSEVNSFALDADGNIYVEIRGSTEFGREIRVYSPHGKERNRFSVRSEEFLRESSIAGIDGSGAIYLTRNVGFGNGAISKYDRRGNLLGEIHVAPETGPRSLVSVRVDGAGNVVVLSASDQALRLDRYSLSRRWELRTRIPLGR